MFPYKYTYIYIHAYPTYAYRSKYTKIGTCSRVTESILKINDLTGSNEALLFFFINKVNGNFCAMHAETYAYVSKKSKTMILRVAYASRGSFQSQPLTLQRKEQLNDQCIGNSKWKAVKWTSYSKQRKRVNEDLCRSKYTCIYVNIRIHVLTITYIVFYALLYTYYIRINYFTGITLPLDTLGLPFSNKHKLSTYK